MAVHITQGYSTYIEDALQKKKKYKIVRYVVRIKGLPQLFAWTSSPAYNP
jgi:hypothetical protein